MKLFKCLSICILNLILLGFVQAQANSAEFDHGIKIGNIQSPSPEIGTIRFNPEINDFEGFDGSTWKSLTFSPAQWGILNNQVNEDYKIEHPNINTDYDGPVDMSSSYFILGGRNNTPVYNASIYKLTNLGWELDTILNSNELLFGRTVNINNNFALICSADSINIFKNQGGTWSKSQQIKIASPLGSVSDAYLQDSIFIIGAREGSAVYTLVGSNWLFDETIIPPDIINSDEFGYSVAIRDTIAVISAFLQNGFKGAVYLYHNRNGNWMQVDKLLADPNDTQFGVSVELDKEHVYVGVRYADRLPSLSRGQVSIYEYNSPNYLLVDEIIPETETRSDEFSFEIDLHDNDLIISARGVEAGQEFGSAFFYRKLSGQWIIQAQMTQSDAIGNDAFAQHLAIHGDWAVVGAKNQDKVYLISK